MNNNPHIELEIYQVNWIWPRETSYASLSKQKLSWGISLTLVVDLLLLLAYTS